MIYTITGIFATTAEASSAAEVLASHGFRQKFSGYTQNTKVRPEALVEDHYIEDHTVHIYTPNLNRAYKARNILHRIGATEVESFGERNVTEKNPVAKHGASPQRISHKKRYLLHKRSQGFS